MVDDESFKPPEVPSLNFVLRQTINSVLNDVHTAMPGKVVEYNRAKRQADIQPLLKRKYKDGSEVAMPVIPNVPVWMPSCNGFKTSIDLPIKVDDVGVILYSERSLDLWLVQGGMVYPNDERKFDLSDAIFFPGLANFSQSLNPPSNKDDLRIINDKLVIDIQASGKMKINNGTFDFKTVFDFFLDNLIAAETMTVTGPCPFTDATKVKLQADKVKLDTFLS